MNKRHITRVAFLQNYEASEEKLYDEVDEVAAKGYTMVYLSGLRNLPATRRTAGRAHELGLEVGIFTGYMKYDYTYLAEHPDQRMVSARDDVDQDGLSTATWGCPFHPDFKARYLTRLRELAQFPGVTHIDLNDEAMLGDGCYCAVCRDAYARELGGDMPRKPEPRIEDWQDPRWRAYLAWRIRRWIDVHAEMAQVIRETNPSVRVSFQTSPAADLWMNPWFTAVDLAGMAESLDRISTDPYYTFHRRVFDPPEVYLSEWCRFLAGIMPEGKEAGLIPQAFTHPTFTRPLSEADGLWAAIVPPALGVDLIAPYTYTLQRCSPTQQPYESAWQKLDSIFEQVRPLRHAAVVHGLKTEVMRYPLPQDTPASYDGTRLFPVAASLRHAGMPYGFLADAKLAHPEELARHKVIVLPQIACLTPAERGGLRAHIRNGGNAVILGDLGEADATGGDMVPSLLTELFDIRVTGKAGAPRTFNPAQNCPGLAKVRRPDAEMAARHTEGALTPFYALSHCNEASIPEDATVLATFEGKTRSPAIVSLERYGGRVVWLAGIPTRTTLNTTYATTVRNLAHQLFARLTDWAASEPCALRVEDWPPTCPMDQLRPLDQRFMPTWEFMPSAGADCFLAVITSYFREPTQFPMVLDIPKGKRLKQVTELLSGATIPCEQAGGTAHIVVEITFDTPALVYRFELE